MRRSRPSWRWPFARPGQSATTRPPWTAPPRTKATPPVPWSVPSVPLTATSRPNSLTRITTVRSQAPPAPRPVRSAARPRSSWRRPAASGPFGLAWLAWVSQPPISSTAACGPFGWARNSAARRDKADEGARARPAPGHRRRRRVLHRRRRVGAELARPLERRRQRRIAGVHALQPGDEVGRRIGQHRGRPGVDVGPAAQHQRHGGVEGEALAAAGGERPAEPAGRELVRPGAAALQHLLGVEVRALAVGQADGVDDRRLAAGRPSHAARPGSDAARRSRRCAAAARRTGRAGRARRRSRHRRSPARRRARRGRRAGSPAPGGCCRGRRRRRG